MKTVTIQIPKDFKMACAFMNIDPAEALQCFADVTSMNSFYICKTVPPELEFLSRHSPGLKEPFINQLNSGMLSELSRKRYLFNGLTKKSFDQALDRFHRKWYKKIKEHRRLEKPSEKTVA